MNKNILSTGLQNYISQNFNTDIVSVLLKKPVFDHVTPQEIVEQLESKKKAERKLPTWFRTHQIYYPNKRNLEQTSSEITALYKSQVLKLHTATVLDITGGFGVDAYFFSKKVAKVHYCEIDEKLSHIACHNFNMLGVTNIETITKDGIDFLKDTKDHFDYIYIDPSRRDIKKNRVFLLSDCLPNVPKYLELLFEHTENVLLKTSPLLDISLGSKELQFVKEIHIVAVSNEVKEILWVLQKEFEGEPMVKTVNLKKNDKECFNFTHSDEKEAISSFGLPKSYLYEPNAAILKSGAFKLVGQMYSIQKLNEHSHLYTSDHLIEFPGRCFKIIRILPYQKKVLKKLRVSKANITTRNFPETVSSIRQKLKISDGGDIYFFFTKGLDNKLIVLQCTKIAAS